MAQKKSGKKAAVPSAEREADNAMLTTAAPDDVPSFDQSMLESQPSPTVEQYLKETTSRLFSIPLGFFTSRQEFRAWGAEKLSDPAVQPLPEKRRRPPTSFPSVLPGYPEESYMMFATSEMPQYRSAAPPGGVRLRHAVVPQNLSMVPREASPAETSRKNLVAPIGYDWKELQSYQMDYQPYVNAMMSPTAPDGMYAPGNALVAYPYGVPAVEENEQMASCAPKWCC